MFWTHRDLNPGPLPCEGSDLPLIYGPTLMSGGRDLIRLTLCSSVLQLYLYRDVLRHLNAHQLAQGTLVGVEVDEALVDA